MFLFDLAVIGITQLRRSKADREEDKRFDRFEDDLEADREYVRRYRAMQLAEERRRRDGLAPHRVVPPPRHVRPRGK
jgi:hypothetical protein